jgi:hypothetical protein
MRFCPAREEVESLAVAHGWAKSSTVQKQPPFSGTEITWSSSGGGSLRYTEDEMTGNCYVVVEATTRGEVQRLGELVLEELLPWEMPELVFAVDNAADEIEFGLSVIRLGIAAPPHRDDQIFRRVRSALTHDDVRVRDMAIVATTYSPWPEYVPILRDIAQSDPEPKLRQRSRLVLESYTDAGIGENE